jgi:hypothetical protein
MCIVRIRATVPVETKEAQDMDVMEHVPSSAMDAYNKVCLCVRVCVSAENVVACVL